MVESKNVLALVVLTALLSRPLYAGPWNSPRLVPSGSVKILETGAEMDREIPAPSGVLMACRGQCYVESAGMQILGADGTIFAVQEEDERFCVLVQKGSLDFALSAEAKPLELRTPFDTLSAKPYLLPAGREALIRGNLQVTDDKEVLTVAQGSLQLTNSTRQEILLHTGNALTMTQSPYTAGSSRKSRDMRDTLTGWAVGAASLGIIGASIAALSSGGGGGGGGEDGDEVSKHE